MSRVGQRDFSGGVFFTPPREHAPPNGLRRGRGIRNPSLGTALRSRWGASRLVALSGAVGRLHSLVTIEGIRHQGIGVSFYMANTLVTTFDVDQRLTFAQAIPVVGQGRQHYLYIAGGGRLVKKRANFPTVEAWGIAPPGKNDNFTATKLGFVVGVSDKLLHAMAAGLALDVWTRQTVSGGGDGQDHAAPVDFLTQSPDTAPGTGQVGSMVCNLDHRNRLGLFAKAQVLDCSHFGSFGGGSRSADQDWITLDVKVDHPGNLKALTIFFGVSDPANPTALPTDLADSYSFEVRVDDATVRAQTLSPSGVGDVGAVRSDQASAVQPADDAPLATPPSSQFTRQALESIAITTLPTAADAWSHLRIPKASFVRPKFDNPNGWAHLNAIGFTVETNDQGPVKLNFANFRMRGGVGMQGDYSYRCTYRNDLTGARSNANPKAIIVKDVPRTGVQLSNLPVASDPQVTHRELWRTVGNGSVWFRLPRLEHIEFTDRLDTASDYRGMFDDDRPDVLTNEELPFDNVQPEDTFNDVAGPHNGQVFWTRDGAHPGRWYFSATGRVESVAGFLQVSSKDDPMQTTVIFAGTPYACSVEHWWAMEGAGTQWIARQAFGVPGTHYPHAAIATPYGIAYLAPDGVRLFDGQSSVVVGAEAMGTLFRGENANGNVPAFPDPPDGQRDFVCAAFWNDEYILTDGRQTLAINLRTQVWREVGEPMASLYREPETNLLLVGRGSNVLGWEMPGVLTDDGSPIDFSIATTSIVPNAGLLNTLAQRLYIDCDTHGQTLDATLFATDDVGAAGGGVFPVVTSGRRTVEIALGSPLGAGYLTLFGRLRDEIAIYGIAFDLHIPEAPGDGT